MDQLNEEMSRHINKMNKRIHKPYRHTYIRTLMNNTNLDKSLSVHIKNIITNKPTTHRHCPCPNEVIESYQPFTMHTNAYRKRHASITILFYLYILIHEVAAEHSVGMRICFVSIFPKTGSSALHE